jgi:hypothetical protein
VVYEVVEARMLLGLHFRSADEDVRRSVERSLARFAAGGSSRMNRPYQPADELLRCAGRSRRGLLETSAAFRHSLYGIHESRIGVADETPTLPDTWQLTHEHIRVATRGPAQ